MAWVVDTCLLIDVADADPLFAASSATALDGRRGDGLVISPVTYVELAPVFAGDAVLLETFLDNLEISWTDDWTRSETRAAYAAWNRYVQAKRAGRAAKRPVADILIGAFAERFDGLMTRNPGDFKGVFPNLKIEVP